MSLNNRIFPGFLKSVDTTGKSASFENLRTFVWPSAEPLHPYRKPLHSRDPFEVRPKYQTKYPTSSRFVCSCWVSFVEFHDLIQSLFHASMQGTAKEKWAGRKQYFISSARHFAPLFNVQTHETVGGTAIPCPEADKVKTWSFFFFSFIDTLHGFSILLSYFQDTKCFALHRAHFFKAPLWGFECLRLPGAPSNKEYLRRSGY